MQRAGKWLTIARGERLLADTVDGIIGPIGGCPKIGSLLRKIRLKLAFPRYGS